MSVVDVLYRSARGVAIVAKPGGIPVHSSDYVGKRPKVMPLLQLSRDTLGTKVNLVHRLDRGASGCVLLCCAPEELRTDGSRQLHEALSRGRKTYVCVTRGLGQLKGENFVEKNDWFRVDREIKDERGRVKEAQTDFRWITAAGADDARVSLVLARPKTGRWHQIRRHLNGLSHPILGDTTHGCSKTNKLWRGERNVLRSERIMLHLARLELPAVPGLLPEPLDISCPLPSDMTGLIRDSGLLDRLHTLRRETSDILHREARVRL